MSLLMILAQAATTASPTGTPTGTTAPAWLQFLNSPFMPIVIVIAFVLLFSSGSKRKQDRARKALLEGLKKGDQVRLFGGEFGTVADVRGTKVLVKVDETSNTKILYAREAIASVEKDEAK